MTSDVVAHTASSKAASAAGDDLAALLDEPAARPLWRRPAPWIALVLLALAMAAGFAWQQSRVAAAAPVYATEAVSRGNLSLSVSANGTLQATRSVNIGSELSGTVARVAVDINDVVRKGQLLVELDTAKLSDQIVRSRATVASAEARVAQAVATVKEAQSALGRLEEVARLSGGKVPSAAELDSGRAALDRARADEAAARAGVTDAKAALATDTTNLSKASIRSPIDGVVLTRSVDPGNAVAASLQAVTLFSIAEDLKRLKLQVNVDEADVGSVRAGQSATFTVSAYARRRYPATITRVAYGSTLTDNVVTYVGTLDVDNADLSLRPGMTATATIIATERRDVLLVPNTALRFTPSGDAAQAGAGNNPAAAGSAAGGDRSGGGAAARSGAAPGGGILSSLMPRMPGGGARRPGGSANAASPPAVGSVRNLWVLRDGRPAAVPVTIGISDGRRTEVTPTVDGALSAGAAVIVDQRTAAAR